MEEPTVLFFVNSDLGVRNTIGARVTPILDDLRSQNVSVLAFCRDTCGSRYPAIKVVPAGRFVMRLLTAVPIYISRRLQTHALQSRVFEFFLLRKLKKVNLKKVQSIVSWQFLPKAYAYLKKQHPHIKIVQDVPIAIKVPDIKDRETLFTPEDLHVPGYINKSLEYSDTFIVPSLFVKDSLVNERVDERKIMVIPFGVNSNIFKPELNKDLSVFNIAFVGAINNRKGIPYLIQAWKELNLSNAILNLYGRVYPEVRWLTEGAGIRVWGHVDVSKELPKNDVYVFPSLLEGSAKSVYEAMASGLPIITTYNAGSIVEDGKEGFVIPVQDVAAIKEKILFFYNNREAVEEFGKRARQKAEQFSWERYAKQVGEIVAKNIA